MALLPALRKRSDVALILFLGVVLPSVAQYLQDIGGTSRLLVTVLLFPASLTVVLPLLAFTVTAASTWRPVKFRFLLVALTVIICTLAAALVMWVTPFANAAYVHIRATADSHTIRLPIGPRPSDTRLILFAAVLTFLLVAHPHWTPGGLSKILLSRPYERTAAWREMLTRVAGPSIAVILTFLIGLLTQRSCSLVPQAPTFSATSCQCNREDLLY